MTLFLQIKYWTCIVRNLSRTARQPRSDHCNSTIYKDLIRFELLIVVNLCAGDSIEGVVGEGSLGMYSGGDEEEGKGTCWRLTTGRITANLGYSYTYIGDS